MQTEPSPRQRGEHPLIGISIAAILMRAPLTMLPPALGTISAELALSAGVAGLTTTLPLLCFAVFAFVTPALTRHGGPTRAMLLAMVAIFVGTLLLPAGQVWTLFVGIALVGIGIAVGNVLVPVVASAQAGRAGRSMSVYSTVMGLGAMAGSLVTGPLLEAGWGWQGVLLLMPPIALLGAIAWWVTMPPEPPTPGAEPAAPTWAAALRRPETWLVTGMMGLQSIVFYSELTWMPSQLTEAGFSLTTASTALALFNGLGAIGSALLPRLLDGPRARAALVCSYALYAAGLLGMAAHAHGILCAAVVALGIAQGAVFASALVAISRAAPRELLPRVSAISQGIGYLLAAVGPTAVGVLGEALGWRIPLIALACSLTVSCACGLLALARTRTHPAVA